MTLEDFAETTAEIAENGGIEGYLPTIAIPAHRHFALIDQIPEGVDHRKALQEKLVEGKLLDLEVIFGVQTGPTEITFGHYIPGQPTRFKMLRQSEAGVVVEDIASANWWTLDRVSE